MGTHPSTNTTIDPVYFWKETQENGLLSQWYPVTFNAPAHPASHNQVPMTFSSAEQYMMYHKAMTFQDFRIAAQIMSLSDPRQQKAKGRQVSGFDEVVWTEIRERIVEEGNWWKFTASTDERIGRELKNLLLGTGDRLLVEASPFDSIWGIGYRAETAEVHRAYWGLNLLGKALMKVRARLGEESRGKNEGMATGYKVEGHA